MSDLINLLLNGSSADYSGNNNHGVVTGTEQYTTGINNDSDGAFLFNNTNYIVVPDATNLNFSSTDPFTILAWVNLQNSASFQQIVAKRAAASNAAGYFFGVTSGELLSLNVLNGTSIWTVNGTNTYFVDGGWHLVAGVYTGGGSPNRNGMKLYIDTLLEATGAASAISGSFTNTGTLNIGADYDFTSTMDNNSQVCRVRIVNEALSITQIRNIFMKERPGIEFATDDNFGSTFGERLNAKTHFIGTEDQLTSFVTNPIGGQSAFVTVENTVYKREKIVRRNAANTAWSNNQLRTVDGSVGTRDVGGYGINTQNNRAYCYSATLPTSEKFYIITYLEGYAQGTCNYVFGIDTFTGSDPTSQYAALGAITQSQSLTTNTLYKLQCTSRVFRGGTVLWPWAISDAAATVGTAQNTAGTWYKAGTYAGLGTGCKFADTTAITTSGAADRPYLKVYYTGYY